MMTIKFEYIGGPRDGLVQELSFEDFPDALIAPADPAFVPDVIPEGTLVDVWEPPVDGPCTGEPLKCQYVGRMEFGGPW
jgi:hypothetical protein